MKSLITYFLYWKKLQSPFSPPKNFNHPYVKKLQSPSSHPRNPNFNHTTAQLHSSHPHKPQPNHAKEEEMGMSRSSLHLYTTSPRPAKELGRWRWGALQWQCWQLHLPFHNPHYIPSIWPQLWHFLQAHQSKVDAQASFISIELPLQPLINQLKNIAPLS